MDNLRFRFRVWDNVDYMSNPFTLPDLQAGRIQFTSEAKLMQFTGLHDKNGKEIYEGDIIRSDGQDSKFIQTVEFHNTNETCGRGWVGVNHIREFLNSSFKIEREPVDRFSYFSMPCDSEIIGNIYETPDLLK